MLILNICTILKIPLIWHLSKIIKVGKETKIPQEMRETFITFKMEKELNKLSNSSKLSVIVKTANKELIKDIVNLPSILLLLLSPWRFI